MNVFQFIDNWIRRPDPTGYIFKYHINQIMNVMSEIYKDCPDEVDTNPQS